MLETALAVVVCGISVVFACVVEVIIRLVVVVGLAHRESNDPG